MKRYTLFATAMFAVCCFVTPVAIAHNHGPNIWSTNSNEKIISEDGDVLIHSDEIGTARITPDGTLAIDDKSLPVSPAQRQLLVQYVVTVNDIQRKGIQMADAASGFAAGMVAEVFADSFSGESEDEINKTANQRAHDFARQALPICKDLQILKNTQNKLVASLPAFKAYAVIADHDVSDCTHNLSSDD